jgi:hypothetical protein
MGACLPDRADHRRRRRACDQHVSGAHRRRHDRHDRSQDGTNRSYPDLDLRYRPPDDVGALAAYNMWPVSPAKWVIY